MKSHVESLCQELVNWMSYLTEFCTISGVPFHIGSIINGHCQVKSVFTRYAKCEGLGEPVQSHQKLCCFLTLQIIIESFFRHLLLAAVTEQELLLAASIEQELHLYNNIV